MTPYELRPFFRATRRPPARSYLRDTTFYRDALLCVEYGKRAAKIGYFQITKQWFNVRSGKCTDELN
jgi:hypothetical protein